MSADLLAQVPAHVRRFAYDICKQHGLQQPAHWMTFLAFAVECSVHGHARMNKEFRQALMDTIGCGPSGVGGAVADVLRAGIVERVEDDKYRLSRDFFGDVFMPGNGRRAQSLVMVVAYDHRGRTLMSARQLSAREQMQLDGQTPVSPPQPIGSPGRPAKPLEASRRNTARQHVHVDTQQRAGGAANIT